MRNSGLSRSWRVWYDMVEEANEEHRRQGRAGNGNLGLKKGWNAWLVCVVEARHEHGLRRAMTRWAGGVLYAAFKQWGASRSAAKFASQMFDGAGARYNRAALQLAVRAWLECTSSRASAR